jgi:uncharacterized protein DUF3300
MSTALMPAFTTSLRAPTAVAASFVLLAAIWGVPPALAQQPQPAAQQQGAAQPLSAQQIDQLVAPIALYPDNLLGQILTASTYPLETVMAARWSAANPNVKGRQLEDAMQQQTWDPSIKALAAVPQVLAMMNDKLDWTQALGDAYLSQPDDIAAAVQRLRLKADATGNLQGSTQQRVKRVRAPQPIIIDGRPEPEYIVIEPIDPDVIYVPIYDPYLVYGPWAYPAYRPFYWYPPGYVAVGVFGFGAPFIVGSALWAHYNWESRHVDIDVEHYNRFNHTNIVNTRANQTWQHDPVHRGNIPYSDPALQQKFSKTNAGNAALNPGLQKGLANTPQPNITNLKGTTTPLNNTATTNLNKNGGLKGTDLKVDKTVDPKLDKTKLNVNGNVNTNNTGTGTGNPGKTTPKTLDQRVNINNNAKVNTNNVNTNTRVNTNAVIHNNAGNNVNRTVIGGGGGGGGGAVNRTVSGGGGGGAVNRTVSGGGGGGGQKDKKKP